MKLPHKEIKAPSKPLEDLSALGLENTVVAVSGKAKRLGRLSELPNLRYLWLSDLKEERVPEIRNLAIERLVIRDYRCPSVLPLTSLAGLQHLAIWNSPKLKSLDGLESLEELKTLILFGNCYFSNLKPVAGHSMLETLCLEGSFSKHLSVETFAPLANLKNLINLRLASIRVRDRSLKPLHNLSNLRSVFIAGTFPKPELRLLAAALPNAKGEFLNTYRE